MGSWDGGCGWFLGKEAESVWLDADEVFFEEGASGLFEGAFAGAELLVNELGGGAVVNFPEFAAFFDFGENELFELGNFLATGRGEGKIDFTVGAEIGDVADGVFASAEAAEDLVVVDEAGVEGIDDGFVAEIGFAVESELDLIADFVGRRGLVEETREALGGDEAAGFLVDEAADDVGAAGGNRVFLFAEGEEEIFGETPVEERADVGNFSRFEVGELTRGDFGMLESGDETILGVAVDKDVEVGADFPDFGHFSAREEDFAEVECVEEDAAGLFAKDAKVVTLADHLVGRMLGFGGGGKGKIA